MATVGRLSGRPEGTEPILVSGSASVSLTTGAGTLTISQLTTLLDVISMDTDNASSSAFTLVKKTATPSGNSVAIEVLSGLVGGTAANLILSTATSVTVYYVAIGV